MFFNKKTENKNDNLSKVAALLIYAAKIDENYSNMEEKIIQEAILKLGADEKEITKILNDAKKLEENSNQILDFTKEVKNMNYESKIKIIETLWQIIYSNNKVDIYEDNLMRRIAGLLYIDSKIMGDIKEKVRGDNSR
ncbi:MAG: TerB family tellurite resistance protein [Candidatus Pelagibacter sp.]